MAERRRVILWAAVVLTIVGVIAAARVEDEPEPRSTRRAAGREAGRPVRGAAAPAAPAALALERLARPDFDAAAIDDIARAWEPPAPPPPPPRSARNAAAAAAAAVPQAPPLPFRYIGRAVEGERRSVFVQAGQEVLLLRSGETVRGTYRVDAVDDRQVTLTYLPLKIVQTLSFGGAP